MFESKPEEPSSLKILKALTKRGTPKDNVDPRISDFENIRTVSQWTGEIHPVQITILKRGALLIGGSHVTIGIDRDNQQVTFSFKEPCVDPTRCEQLRQLVVASLGSGWRVKMLDDDSRATRTGTKAAKPKRTRSRKKAGKRRK